jgi:hypothetical protein
MRTLLCGAFLCVALSAAAQTNYIALSNLQQTNSSYLSVYSEEFLAASFTTDGYSVTNFIASISLFSGGSGALVLSLYNDNNGPSNKLAVLSGNNYPGAGITTYTNLAGVSLAANTKYWIVASSTNTQTGSAYNWNATQSTAADPGSIWQLDGAEAFFFGSVPIANLQFNITIPAPPVPPLSIFQPVMITFPNDGFPFVLQQNTNLTSPNWVTATGAVQLSTVANNQIVFLVPPADRQMFFRLSLP